MVCWLDAASQAMKNALKFLSQVKKIYFEVVFKLWLVYQNKSFALILWYLNPIKFRGSLIFARFIFVPLIFAQLNNLCIRALTNLYFPVCLSYDWKCSARHRVKYAKIRAFSDSYFSRIWTESYLHFPVYGKIRIRFCPHTERYGREKARISAYFTQWGNRSWMWC